MTWTMKELREAVRLRRAGWNYGHIAGVLGRPRELVRHAVIRHAPDLRRPRATFEGFAPKVLELHARGYSDADSARKLGVSRNAVMAWRRRLGLGDNRSSDRQRARYRAHFRRVAHAAGKPHVSAIRAEVYRIRAARAGWPDADRPAEVEVLDLLCDRGPLTKRQLTEARGLRPRPKQRLLTRLVRRGLVARVDRADPAGHKLPSLYRLADGVGRHQTHVCHRVRGEEGVGS